MINRIPLMLIYSRLLIGFIIIALSYFQITHYNIIAIILLSIGLLTDIFDGIIARKLQISTQNLRRLDSTIDQVFFVSVVFATFLQCPDFFYNNSIPLFLLIGFEALTYLILLLEIQKRNCNTCYFI